MIEFETYPNHTRLFFKKMNKISKSLIFLLFLVLFSFLLALFFMIRIPGEMTVSLSGLGLIADSFMISIIPSLLITNFLTKKHKAN